VLDGRRDYKKKMVKRGMEYTKKIFKKKERVKKKISL
jgi:hypothetical protein